MATIAGGGRRILLLGVIGALVLAAAGAAWYFLNQEPAAPPQPVAHVQVRKVAPKPAAAKPEAPPIPKTADAAVTEVIARAGLDTFARNYRESALQSIDASAQPGGKLGPEEQQAFHDAVERALADDKVNNLIAEQLKRSFEPIQFGHFIELLRTPISEKMTKLETKVPQPDEVKQYMDGLKSKPPTQQRRDLIQRIDLASGTSEWASEMSVVSVRSVIEGAMAASGKSNKAAARDVERKMTELRRQLQAQIHTLLFFVYREASDAELKKYAELLESETGRWGTTMIANALKNVIETTGRDLGGEIAKAAVALREAKAAKEKPAVVLAEAPKDTKPAPAPETEAKPDSRPAAKPVAQIEKAKPAPVPVGYQRPANLPVLYAHYNDLVSAVWMGDFAAARQLLDDGKSPNARDADDNTALMIAVQRGDRDMAQLLLVRGAETGAGRPDGPTPLDLARRADDYDMVRLLESHGAKR